jgi:hypothetical protein
MSYNKLIWIRQTIIRIYKISYLSQLKKLSTLYFI